MDAFDDIRPYNDAEVRPTLDRLLAEPQFLATIAAHRFPKLIRWCRPLMLWLVGTVLKLKTRDVSTVRQIQILVKPYLQWVIESTTDGVTVSGLDKLDRSKAYLFLSNHRDIVLDPALVNYALFQHHMETCQIAIGDNLLKRPFVSDLMRLNKSFIVRRSLTSRRDKLVAFQALSGYIHHSINTGQPVWIAQSEGRAKDGNDRTDPAILKMFNLSKRSKDEPFSQNLRELNIVPVSISYEVDPCGSDKARELTYKLEHGHYQKADDEDLNSIVKGISGYKGRVHVAFGEPLVQIPEEAPAVAALVDQQIHANYQLYPNNLIALQQLQPEITSQCKAWFHTRYPTANWEEQERGFKQLLNECEPAYQNALLKMYAQPVLNQLVKTA